MRALLCLLVGALALAGCECDVPLPDDAGAPDAGPPGEDAGPPDPERDAGPSLSDAGADDAGACASDADCPTGLVCDLATGACTTECRTGPVVAIDVPSRAVPITVTVEGAALPPTGAGAPSLAISSARSGAEVVLPLFDAAGAPGPGALRLTPGETVEVFLNGGGPLPLANHARVSEAMVATSGPLPVDVPTAPLLVVAELEGAPLPSITGEAPSQVPSLWLYPAGGRGVAVPLYEVDGSSIGAPIGAQTVDLFPGVFQARYWRAHQASPFDRELPLGWHVVDEALDVATAGLVEVDVPRGRLSLDVTLDGAPIPAGPAGLIVLFDDVGRAVQLPQLDDTGHTEAWLVPGDYRVRYRAIAAATSWPVTDTPLGTITVAPGTTAAGFDVPVETLSLSIALARPGPTCLGSARVGVRRVDLRPTGVSSNVLVTPGRHSVFHLPRARCGREVPLLAPRILGSADIAGPTRVDLVIDAHRVAIDLRFDGAAPAPLDASEGPTLVFSDVRPLAPSFDPTVGEAWLAGGMYTLLYQPPRGVEDAGDWPMTGTALATGLVVDDDASLAFDLRRVRVSASLTIGGAPAPSLERPPFGGAPPELLLSGTSGEPAPWRYWNASFTTPLAHDHWALPGRYELEYDARGGARWSVTDLPAPGVDLGCWLIEAP